jgi:hypothetical protein
MSLTLGGPTPAARQSGLYVHVDDFGFLRWGVSEPPEPVQPTICRMVIFYRTDTFRVPTLKKNLIGRTAHLQGRQERVFSKTANRNLLAFAVGQSVHDSHRATAF